jgi:glucokinase
VLDEGERSVIVLAGDTGGTNTRLGLFAVESGSLQALATASFANASYSGLEEVVSEFLRGRVEQADAATFAVAGPVTGDRVRLTNLGWTVDAGTLCRASGVTQLSLVNDLEAMAWAAIRLDDDRLHVLQPGAPDARGNGAVIAAGTGLGQAGVYFDGAVMRPFACEGGHASFSPTDESGDMLLAYLRTRFESVSWERVLSGSGLADIYRVLLDREGRELPAWFVEADRAGDPVPAVTAAGLESRCDICRSALELFARLYGAEAANLALKMMATGGVWVGGGIAPKILSVLDDGHFMTGFLEKGRMRPLLERIPVRVILDEHAALEGAAHHAATTH